MPDPHDPPHEPPPAPSPFRRIVVPVEGSSEELLAQQGAVEMAAAGGVELVAVHVSTGVADPPEDVFDYLAGLCEELSVPFERRLLHASDVAEELLAELEAGDLAIIGTRELARRNSSPSVAHELVRRAPCPVQVIRVK